MSVEPYLEISIWKRLTDQQPVFDSVSMVSQGGIAAQVDYIKAAKAAGVKLFVPAEVGFQYPVSCLRTDLTMAQLSVCASFSLGSSCSWGRMRRSRPCATRLRPSVCRTRSSSPVSSRMSSLSMSISLPYRLL